MVYQLTKFHVQRVDMVINPPWNLPFLGAKGLTSPEQTATVEMVFSQPWVKALSGGQRLTTPSKWLTVSLEVDTQLKQEIFQRENSVSNQSVPSFDQLFELNELKAQSQEKDTVIKKLKERIKSLSGKMDKDKIKQDFEEIETINIELDHREKALAITALKDELRKLKGKALVDNNVSNHPSDPELHQVNVEPITPKLLNKRQPTSAYI
ncbi:hypothetical protein Tco_1019157 [Tanacetum coccineum]|uniref:Uncharacterized protein n=1 Tax=Tanacetum coccineum TaxID=301880 RepID=A0ABQ5FY89_9ASTR